MTNYETRDIQATGRQQCITSISTIVYPRVIVAISDSDHITQYQMRLALNREFPRHSFVFNGNGGKYTLRADAARWVGDGIDEKKQESEK